MKKRKAAPGTWELACYYELGLGILLLNITWSDRTPVLGRITLGPWWNETNRKFCPGTNRNKDVVRSINTKLSPLSPNTTNCLLLLYYSFNFASFFPPSKQDPLRYPMIKLSHFLKESKSRVSSSFLELFQITWQDRKQLFLETGSIINLFYSTELLSNFSKVT